MNPGFFASQLLQTLLAVGLAPLMLGWVNRCRAWLQNKTGPGVLQPYRVILKLFRKDAVLAHNASGCFASHRTWSSAAWYSRQTSFQSSRRTCRSRRRRM
jgi:formate hydrogenlyase subunit 4